MYQHTTNWADGVAGVNQCPISPGESFLYQFSTTGQAGTYWYHSHYREFSSFRLKAFLVQAFSGTQYCDGLRGPLVIYDPNDPAAAMYDIDDGE